MSSSTQPEMLCSETSLAIQRGVSQPELAIPYPEMLLYAALVGVVGGLFATGYHYLLEGSLHGVWQTIPTLLSDHWPLAIALKHHVWIFTSIGGLLVGLTLRLMGLPGEVSLVVDKIHDPGRIDWRQTPAMLVVSLISITAGGSAGPEAPLVQINGSFGSWLSDRLQFSVATSRLLTFCGMSAALSAFFGAPLGGALFALEIPHRRSLEYYEALIPAIISALCSFVVFRGMTGMAVTGGVYHLPSYPPLTWIHLLQGALLGMVGSGVALLFIYLFRSVKTLIQPLEHYTILLSTLGGLSIGLIAMVFPQTLFFGEQEIETILIQTGASLGVVMLLGIALAKMLAVACTVSSGFRGGFFFPLFFIGAAVGLAISLTFPQVHPTIAIICMMASVNAAVTKTPIGTSIILSTLCDQTLIPVIAIASFASFLLTMNVSLIQTQRSRKDFVELPDRSQSVPVLAAIDSSFITQ